MTSADDRAPQGARRRYRHLRGLIVPAALFIAGCGGAGRHGDTMGTRGCALADSLLRASGLAGALELSGRTTIDVNQYRVRGRFSLAASEDGDVLLEFTSTSPMGGRREDVVVSLYRDTLRIFDRERAELHEEADIVAMVEEETGLPLDLRQLIPLVLGFVPRCERLSDLDVSDSYEDVSGRVDGKRFDLSFSRARLMRARWPLPLLSGGSDERVEIDYRWGDGGLERVTALLPGRSWRVKLLMP